MALSGCGPNYNHVHTHPVKIIHATAVSPGYYGVVANYALKPDTTLNIVFPLSDGGFHVLNPVFTNKHSLLKCIDTSFHGKNGAGNLIDKGKHRAQYGSVTCYWRPTLLKRLNNRSVQTILISTVKGIFSISVRYGMWHTPLSMMMVIDEGATVTKNKKQEIQIAEHGQIPYSCTFWSWAEGGHQ
jgi:hypothetical protein